MHSNAADQQVHAPIASDKFQVQQRTSVHAVPFSSQDASTKPIKAILNNYFQQTMSNKLEQQTAVALNQREMVDESTKPVNHLKVVPERKLSDSSLDELETLKLNKKKVSQVTQSNKELQGAKQNEKVPPGVQNDLSLLVRDSQTKVADESTLTFLMMQEETLQVPTLKIMQKISEELSKNGGESQSVAIEDSSFIHLNGGLAFFKREGRDIVIHSKIYEHFGAESIEKVSHNQTVLKGSEGDNLLLNSVESIQKFLQKSAKFKHLENIEMLAEGGEAIVFKINYAGYEELVLKVPKTKHQTKGGFEDLIYESQLIKCLYHEDYLVEIKEEIIEIDTHNKKMLKYLVVVERARFSLQDLYGFRLQSEKFSPSGLWFNARDSQQLLERFSLHKFFYYFFQALKALDYLHSKGVVYSDMKPHNLLVMRNQKLKIGDFGVSTVTLKGKMSYKLKGLTPSWCVAEVKEAYYAAQERERQGLGNDFYAQKWPLHTLKYNDFYGLALAFSPQILKYIQNECSDLSKRTPADLKVEQFFSTLISNILEKRTISTHQVINEVGNFMIMDGYMLLSFVQQLKNEKKNDGAYEVSKFIKQRLEEFKEIKSEHKQMIFIRIYSIMGEFLFYQSEYKKALQELTQVQQYIRDYMPQVKGSTTAQELKQLKMEIGLMEAKSFFYLGHLVEGEKKANEIFRLAKEEQKLADEFEFHILELKGQIELNKGNYEAATPFYLQYAQLIDKKQGKEEGMSEQREIRSFFNLGQVFCKLGQYEKSLQFYQKAQEVLMQHLVQNSPSAARKESKFTQSLQQQTEWSPYMLDCLKQEGNVLVQLGQFERAQQNFDRALKICQQIFGEKNAITAETYMQIAGLYSRKSNPLAKYNYQKALAIFDFLYGEDNYHSADIYNNMASVFEGEGDLPQAEKMCQRALDIKLKYQQAETDSIAQVYMNLGAMKRKQGNIPDACDCYQKAYAIFVKLGYSFKRQQVIITFQNYVKCLIALSKGEQALKICQDAFTHDRQSTDRDPVATLNIIISLGQTLISQKQYVEAMNNLVKALQIFEGLPAQYAKRETKFELLRQLASCCSEVNSPNTEMYYREAFEAAENGLDKITILKEIALIKATTGKYQEAVDYLNQLESIIEPLKPKVVQYDKFHQMVVQPLLQFRQECQQQIKK